MDQEQLSSTYCSASVEDETIRNETQYIDETLLDQTSTPNERGSLSLGAYKEYGNLLTVPSSKFENGDDGYEPERTAMTPEIPSFPQLSNNSPSCSTPEISRGRSSGDDEDPALARGFERLISPSLAIPRDKNAFYNSIGDEGICKMHKFSLYETASRFYIIGGDIVDRKFRILKIDRTVDSGDLRIDEDSSIYTKREMNELLNTIDDGNKSTGGLKLRCNTWGLLGFIRFTGAYYMLVLTKRSQVAMIGGHYVYQVDGTELISLTASMSSRSKLDRDAEEGRFIGTLSNLDLSRSFYFSYSYDITRSLQNNILSERERLRQGSSETNARHHNEMFVWNHHLLEPASRTLGNTYDWCIPIIHGFVDQASKSTVLSPFIPPN